ncbi:efflux RND transporter permease subunit [Frankia sp. QA3]|uniref:MMPL family transporter n=1 Tax=Frankia sp. QA3 TaxID=710111 RepID=UPI000269BE4E|nr:efflux RND transporter permease subunit [Frankia sp. QA3]EIV92344.1 putative RND superfamily drug exporter [Frankia sp. QA3]
MTLLVRWCQRYRWLVVAVWLISLIAATGVAQQKGARFSQDLGVTGAESQQAMDLVASIMPDRKLPDLEMIVVRARAGDVQAPEVRARVATMIEQIGKLPGVGGVFDPYSPLGAVPLGGSPLSADGHTAIVSVLMKGSPTSPDLPAMRALIATARDYDGPDLQVEVTGPATTVVVQGTISPWPIALGIGVALIILCLAVRSPAAVTICAVTAGATTAGALAGVTLLSRQANVMQLAPLLALVLAFGLSLGSALVIVNRCQSGLRQGLKPEDAARAAMRHPGRATLAGSLGLAVVMLGTSALRLRVFDGLALAGFTAAAVSILVVATLLPALLRICGSGLLVWAERTYLLATGTGLPVRPGLRVWWAGIVGRHPQVLAGAAVLLLTALALPVVGLRLGGTDNGVDPTSTTSRRAYDLISEEYFPGLNGQLIVVATGVSPDQPAALPHLLEALNHTPGVTRAFLVLQNAPTASALIQVMPSDPPRSAAASDLVHRLRSSTVPAAIAYTSLEVYVGGQTAIFEDMSDRFARVLPAFLLLELGVLGLAVLLGLRSVRHSLAITAASMLALAATLGVITSVFCNGWLASGLGVRTGPIEPFILGLILIIVFGLSIGMHLTLLSRLRGSADAPDPQAAISSRHADVGGVVITISMIMVAVFVALTTQQVRMMKLLGVGLSVGVILDALVLRVVLLPALIHLVGLDHRRGGDPPPPNPTAAPRRGPRRRLLPAGVPMSMGPAGLLRLDIPAAGRRPPGAPRAAGGAHSPAATQASRSTGVGEPSRKPWP